MFLGINQGTYFNIKKNKTIIFFTIQIVVRLNYLIYKVTNYFSLLIK